MEYFRKNTFSVFVEIGGPALTPGYVKFKYIGIFYVRTYEPDVTLDRYTNAKNKINDDVSASLSIHGLVFTRTSKSHLTHTASAYGSESSQ